ncbi:MAG: hypothetical protein V4546_08045 [Bacteroidota bacterium]
MTTETPHIRIGHFNDFHGKNCLLISADIHGLLELEEVFLKLSNGLELYDFSTLKLLDKKFRINLIAFNGTHNSGIRKSRADNYEWIVTKEKWGHFRERVTGLYRIGNEGNRKLNSESEDEQEIEIIFSWNEYPLKLWTKLNKENKNAL